MTEERMICELREPKYKGSIQSAFDVDDRIWVPPKDFLPICRYMKLCSKGVSMGWEPCLMRCPYREETK